MIILLYNFCEAKYHDYHDYCLNYTYTENCIQACQTPYTDVPKCTAKPVMVSARYHNITRLLLVTIIDSSKNRTISIIDKENITFNRQNQLIAHL